MSAPCPVFGFTVRVASNRDVRALHRDLSERLGDVGLLLNEVASTIVVTREGSQATESDRQLVIALLANELDADGATVSDLVDLSY